MTPERRAQIIAQTLAILQRHSELRSRRSDVPPPPEDPVARWRRECQEFEALREGRRALTRAEEERHREGQREAADLFWQSVDQRIAVALEAERAFMTDMLRDAIQAVGDASDATVDKFEQLDVKLNGLAKLLQSLREGNARSRAAAEVIDVPPPKDLN